MAKADIEVHGRAYSVACSPGQESRLSALAVELDKRVSVIESAVGNVGEDRLLLVAALALLDELHASRAAANSATQEADRNVADVLVRAAERIEALATRAEAQSRERRHEA